MIYTYYQELLHATSTFLKLWIEIESFAVVNGEKDGGKGKLR